MRLMTCSECESTRLIVLVLLHRCASTSNRDPRQQSGSITVGGIQCSKQDAGSKERQIEGVSNWVLVWQTWMDDLTHLRGHATHMSFFLLDGFAMCSGLSVVEELMDLDGGSR